MTKQRQPKPVPTLSHRSSFGNKGNRDMYVAEITRFMFEFRSRAHYVALLDPLRGIAPKKQAKDPWRTKNAPDYARLLRNYPDSVDWTAVGLQHVPPDEEFYIGHSVTQPATFRSSIALYTEISDTAREENVSGFRNWMTLNEILHDMVNSYAKTVAVETTHLFRQEQKTWLRSRLPLQHPEFDKSRQLSILRHLVRQGKMSDILAHNYPSVKRFDLAGCEALIPAMKEMLARATGNKSTALASV